MDIGEEQKPEQQIPSRCEAKKIKEIELKRHEVIVQVG